MAQTTPFPNFDWSHLPSDWYEFIGGEANEKPTEPLKPKEAFQIGRIEIPAGATFDAEYYARHTCWTLPMALQIVEEMNELSWGNGVGKKLRESLRLSYSGRDGWLMVSLFPEKDGKGQTLVSPYLFCNWADTKGFKIWRTIREIQIGFDENRNSLNEECAKMLELHRVYKESLQREVPRESEAQTVSEENHEEKILTPKTGKRKAGRKASPLKALVMAEAILIRSEKGLVSAPKISKLSRITKILAPGANHTGLKDISNSEYKKRFGHKPGTLEDWIREAFKENPPR